MSEARGSTLLTTIVNMHPALHRGDVLNAPASAGASNQHRVICHNEEVSRCQKMDRMAQLRK